MTATHPPRQPSAPRHGQPERADRPWSLRQRLARASLLLSLLATLLVLAAGITMGAMARTQQRVVGELFDAVVESALMFRSLVDQESGLRGYALSADPSFLRPYREGVGQEERSYAALQRFYSDDPQLRAAIDRARTAATQWRAEVAEPRIALVAARGRGAVTIEQLDEGRVSFDEVRAANIAHRDLLLATRDRERGRLVTETWLLLAVLIVSAVTALVSGVAVWRALRGWVHRPLRELGAGVRRVQSGDLDHAVSVRGPQEIRSLGDDVDAMRRRILREYSGALRARRYAEVAHRKLQVSARQLEDQARDLQRSNRDLEQFAYVASHDLQEPLRKVASFCQMLERRYSGQLDERADQYIAFAVDGAKRMQVLINDLLAFSRVGRVTSGFTDVDLDGCVRRALRVLEPELSETGAQVSVGQLPVVPGEASLLTQLFQNLIGNAVKFRRPDVAPRVSVEVRGEGERWEFAVRDNGIGVEPQYAEKIFVIFQRLHAKEQYGGTGIGLALCKKIVEHHGGQIWLDAADRGDGAPGTTFRFTLPAVAPPADRDEAGPGASRAGATAAAGATP